MSEFSLIEKYFNNRGYHRSDVQLGIGDDCAVLQIPENKLLAVSTDTLVAGRHFHKDMSPKAIGHKSLAVNLSDLAAMGAEPAWVSLAITLPEEDDNWLSEFSDGFIELAEYYQVQLIGGDTTQGPLSITVTAHGFVPSDKLLTRSKAKPGDWIYVSGNLGDAGLALECVLNNATLSTEHHQRVMDKLLYPKPRLMMGQAIRGIASSAMDLSDGLLGDLQHILKASKVGAILKLEELPLSEAMQQSVSAEQAIEYALSSGDDYELCFTVSEEQKGALQTALAATGSQATCIGQITANEQVLELSYHAQPYSVAKQAFQHFL